MTEFAVGMGVLLLLFFFPLVDLLSIGVSYGLASVLNSNQTREASLLRASDASDLNGIIRKSLPDQWLNGMGKFVKIIGYPETFISYRNGEEGDKFISVATTITMSPFLKVPFPVVDVPGLNGPMTFTIVSECPMENPDYAGPTGKASLPQGPGGNTYTTRGVSDVLGLPPKTGPTFLGEVNNPNATQSSGGGSSRSRQTGQ
ncbi:MAG: hypothetical protein K8F91_14845 [Candidatus Obscuribacterales bacterium]|nr:hypothetical protein [Candidatus Obscuribacterales bacterium]